MTTWDGLRDLARRLLGVSDFEPVDMGKVSQDLTPPPEPKTSAPTPEAREPEVIEILPEYEFVLGAIKSGFPAVFVTGRAGTGKSTMIRFLCKEVESCAVVAPTALAASNVRGATIHSFFNIPWNPVNPGNATDPTRKMVEVIEVMKVLIVDEVSMVTPDLVDCIDNTLKKVLRNPAPFGGINRKPWWLNGTLGTIVGIEDAMLRVELRAGNTVSVEREEWEKIDYEYDSESMEITPTVVGTFKQFPLTLGWAMTIHKSQGMTLDSLRLDLGRGAFCSGQTYVALSRCKTLKGITLDKPISMTSVKADPQILEFYARLKPLRNENKGNC